MSSGSYNVGSLVYRYHDSDHGYFWVPGLIGSVKSKSWSGANRAKSPAVWIEVPRINPRWRGEGDTINQKWYRVMKKSPWILPTPEPNVRRTCVQLLVEQD